MSGNIRLSQQRGPEYKVPDARRELGDRGRCRVAPPVFGISKAFSAAQGRRAAVSKSSSSRGDRSRPSAGSTAKRDAALFFFFRRADAAPQFPYCQIGFGRRQPQQISARLRQGCGLDVGVDRRGGDGDSATRIGEAARRRHRTRSARGRQTGRGNCRKVAVGEREGATPSSAGIPEPEIDGLSRVSSGPGSSRKKRRCIDFSGSRTFIF